jgi:hypothetical protein
MSDSQQIVFFDLDAQFAVESAEAFRRAGLRHFAIEYRPTLEDVYSEKTKYDGISSFLAAAERYNVRPIEDTVQIVETDEESRLKGIPAYMFVGPAVTQQHFADVGRTFKIWAQGMLELLRGKRGTISRVMVPPDILPLHDVGAQRAAKILSEAEAATRP